MAKQAKQDSKAGPPADRRAKIQAAAPRGGTGANRAVIGAVVAVVAVIAIAVTVAIASNASKDRAGSGGSALPPNAAAMGAPIVANPDAQLVPGAPTLDLYEDFQCPACADLERRVGKQLGQLAEEGKVKLQVHVMSFLDDNLRNDSSNRAANAAACADGAGAFLAYHDAVFAGQPAQEGQGYTDAQLRGFAEQAGITGEKLNTWQQCYDDRSHNQYVESVQTQSTKDGVSGTPTLKLNGQPLDVATLTAETLEAQVKAATT